MKSPTGENRERFWRVALLLCPESGHVASYDLGQEERTLVSAHCAAAGVDV